MGRKIILDKGQAPGDIIVFSTVVRDACLQYPEIQFDVRSCCMTVFENNPHIKHINPEFEEHEYYNVGYTEGVNKSNTSGEHFSNAYYKEVNKLTGLNITQTSLSPDIHLTIEELKRFQRKFKLPKKYWIVNAGFKSDAPLKSWGFDSWKKVVKGMHKDLGLNVVQIGEKPNYDSDIIHYHPELNDVISLVGETNLRELFCLVFLSQGVISHVTAVMHLAASFNKPCVVLAGGREPRRWEMYPNHRYLDTIGFLDCCKYGGCWKSGKISIEDGKVKKSLCTNVEDGQAKCMKMISHHQVLSEISKFYIGGILE